MEAKAPSLYLGIESELAWELDRFPSFASSAATARRLVVQSFDWHFVRRYRQAQPEVPVGLLGAPPLSQLPELSLWADKVSPHHRSIDAAYVARVNQLGMDVLTWTVDDVVDLKAALDRGVDGSSPTGPRRSTRSCATVSSPRPDLAPLGSHLERQPWGTEHRPCRRRPAGSGISDIPVIC